MSAGILIAAHKPIATAFFSAALGILKQIPDTAVLDIDSDAPPQAQAQAFEAAWSSLQSEEKIVILDVEGATPCNLLRQFCKGRKCLFVLPLSMPLLLKLICYRHLPLKEIEKKAHQIEVTTYLTTE